MSIIDEKRFLLSNFVKNYCEFFFYDNQVALTQEGRDFLIILVFLDTLIDIFEPKIKKEDLQETMSLLRQTVSSYIKDKKEHETIIKNESKFNISCNDDIGIRQNELIKIFKTTEEHLKEFLEAYSFTFSYYNAPIETLLVEFNNYLSHILKAVNGKEIESNISRANAHLHRGTLDAYKNIIKSKFKNISLNTNDKNEKMLLKELFELRLKEIEGIGFTEDEKIDITNEYKAFAWELKK